MKHIYSAALMLSVLCAAVYGAPCWSQFNTCPETNVCTLPVTPIECSHVYCDDGQTCPTDGSKKRMMETTRLLYTQWVGQHFTQCLSDPISFEPWTSACCLCSNPGTLY